MLSQFWRYSRWTIYVVVLFFSLMGAGLTTHWPGYVKHFWYNILVKKWLMPDPALTIGGKAPDFALKNLSGQNIQLNQQLGRPTIISFWATWCKPCRDEIPMLSTLYNEYRGRGFKILAVTNEKKWQVEGFIAHEQKIPYTILMDTDETVSKLYREHGIPLTFVIDASGAIRHKKIGYDKDKRKETELEYRTLIEKLLAETGS